MPTWSDRCHEMRFKAAIQNTAVFTSETDAMNVYDYPLTPVRRVYSIVSIHWQCSLGAAEQ